MQKLSMRSIRREDVERIILEPNQRFADVEHDARVAIGPVNGRILVAVYRVVNTDVKVIAVYHASRLEKLVSSKAKRGAWRET
jgi:hypothetical protein